MFKQSCLNLKSQESQSKIFEHSGVNAKIETVLRKQKKSVKACCPSQDKNPLS